MARLTCGEQRVEMPVSYFHDSLRDLLSAVVAILEGARDVTVVFMDEPGEHQMQLTRIEHERVKISVAWFEDWRSWGLGSGEGRVVLSCETRIAHLRGQVLAAASQIIESAGVARYRELSRDHDFPMEQYKQLNRQPKTRQLTSHLPGAASPNSAITFLMSIHTSFFAAGVRRRNAGW